MDERLGQLDAGLFFIGFHARPRSRSSRCRRGSARSDALNEYISHKGSAVFAVPPGVERGEYVGQALLA